MHDKFVIVAGMQKGGTSSLYNLLSSHPQIVPSNRTETEFFTFPIEENGAARRYAGFFSAQLDHPDQWCLDVSPGYFVSPYAPNQIAEVLGTPRIIIIARAPLARAYSAWKMQQTKGSDLLPFEQSIRLSAHYLDHGRCATHAQRFIDSFGRENVCLLLFDDIKQRPRDLISQIADFLQIDAFETTQVPYKNVGGMPRSKLITAVLAGFYNGRAVMRKAGLGAIVDSRSIDRLSRRLRNRVAEWNRNPQAGGPGPTAAAHAYVMQELGEEIDRFEQMTGRDLSAWRQPA